MNQRAKVIAAFATVYLVWGSTYLAIRVSVETLPPFLMMGVRFLIAGALLLLMFGRRGQFWPSREQWRSVLILSTGLMIFGTGVMGWVIKFVPSGIAALLVAVQPVWLVLIEGLMPSGRLPGKRGMIGVGSGLLGLALLITPESFGGQIAILPLLALLLSTLGWSAASIYSRHTPLGLPPLVSTGWQMLVGGIALTIMAFALGERAQFETFSLNSLLALAYLIVIGSLLVFPCYMFLLRHCPPALVGTHAYVNPLVALLLGWKLLDEPITPRTLVAGAIILAAVFLIGTDRGKGIARTPDEPPKTSRFRFLGMRFSR